MKIAELASEQSSFDATVTTVAANMINPLSEESIRNITDFVGKIAFEDQLRIANEVESKFNKGVLYSSVKTLLEKHYI